jgi:N-acyl-D-aspartate/D-glutamate deacylase
MRHVVVNGALAFADGDFTGARAGEVLRRRLPPRF